MNTIKMMTSPLTERKHSPQSLMFQRHTLKPRKEPSLRVFAWELFVTEGADERKRQPRIARIKRIDRISVFTGCRSIRCGVFSVLSKDRLQPHELHGSIFRVVERSLSRKVAVGCAPLSPPLYGYRSFHGFRVSRRDIRYYYEKRLWATLRLSPPYDFSWFRVPLRDMRDCGECLFSVLSKDRLQPHELHGRIFRVVERSPW